MRTIIPRLQPNGTIPRHMDRTHLLSHCHRIHIPIITNEKINFAVGNENMNLKEGEVWEINNRRKHHVENESELDRIHIIIDWRIPEERCCCGIKRNPQGKCSPDECLETDYIKAPCNCLD